MLLGVSSKFKITVEPVVVIPDMLSKNASLKERFNADNKKGILPKIATISHAIVENKKVCCKFKRYSFSIFVSINKMPIKIVINEDDRKLWLFSW